MKKIIYACYFMLLFVACQGEKYPYLKGFQQYMLETHQVDITTNEKIFYLLPLSDCNSCMGTTLNLEALTTMNKPNDKLCIILIGTTQREDFQESIRRLSKSYEILRDKQHAIDLYQTGVEKPVLLELTKGKVNYYLNILDGNIAEAKAYLMQ